jgi:hypothetical protein
MGTDRRKQEIEATREYYNTIINAFEDVLVEYEEEEKYEDCAVIVEVIDDLKKEIRLIEIAEYTGRSVSY